MDSLKHKPLFNLIKNCFWGVVAISVAFWIVSYAMKVNPYHEYLLITKGITANGFITKAEEYEDEVDIPDAQGGGSEAVTKVYYEYDFTTEAGKIINGRSSELEGIQDFKGKPIPIQVEYLKDNPDINRVKDATSQCKTIGEFIWRRICLGTLLLLMFSAFGLYMIRRGIKDYLGTKRKISNAETSSA